MKNGGAYIPLLCVAQEDRDVAHKREEEDETRSENLSQLDDDCGENTGGTAGRGTKTVSEVVKKKVKRQKRF